MQNNKGFTLVEVLIATVVLAIGLIGLWTLQLTAITSNTRSYIDTAALFNGSEHVEIWMNHGYSNMDLTDTGAMNGTNQDNNKDGVDDDGGNFGLNDFPGCGTINPSLVPGCTDGPADHTLPPGPDGTVVHWNVAINYPLPFTKTIRVHILRPMAGSVPITIEYIKKRKGV